VINQTLPRIFALAPDGLEGFGVVAAASRAAALGILDLCSGLEGDWLKALERLAHLTSKPFGVRVRAQDAAELGGALPLCDGLRVVCVPVTAGDVAQFDQATRKIRERGRHVLAEVTSRAEARSALRSGPSGLIVAGNEAGGRGGTESSFVLMQGVLAEASLPVWVRGGIGPHVAAGCIAAGAAGVVLDGSILLARESPLDAEWRERIARWDGTETTVVAPIGGSGVRVYARPGAAALLRLRRAAEEGGAAWEAALSAEVGWRDGQCAPVGQDAALAHELARVHVTVGGIVQAIERSIPAGIAAARVARPLAAGAPLAVACGTRYPILQGPMTRVSDVAGFAHAVARDGGLPFLALALMRGPEVHALLREVSSQLAGQPWGVGILGFVPPELRAEQLDAVSEAKPPFALIAGGRPDQALGLERQGIATFLHVPSPGLLEQYLRAGSRRFILEGRECGGHVGPRSSFVLWEQAIAVVGAALDHGIAACEVSLVFAGGIHDAPSAALVSVVAGPLAARGVKVGILVGTAYLFTQESVATGAIVQRFQDEVLRCEETVLLESGPGHQVRVSPTPFVARFEEERQRLLAEGRPTDVIREALEGLNVGRLRVATKGIDRTLGAGSPLVPTTDEYQAAHGLYMLGQVAALRRNATTIAELHRELCDGSTNLIDGLPSIEGLPERGDLDRQRPSDIAIIGMAAVFPGADSAAKFWSNTLRGVDAITEVPPDRWDWRLYYDPDPKAPDKIVSKWGGFVPDIAFDPLRYGMPPSSLPSIEPAQLLALEVVRTALDDAGYGERPFPREQTAVVLGMGGGAAQVAMGYAFRSYLPMLDAVIPAGGKRALEACQGLLPEWTEDSFPGFLLNVTAGRIANRLNLGGANYTVDAACGSSLAAAALAVRELEIGAADMVILGGVDTVQNPFTYLAFSKTQAFSPRGRCRPFDAGADGIVISEGVAALVLKRRADAERDGDRIYAVIKGVGASSDGRARGLTAPVVEGQTRALERAYAKAGVSPATVGYIEAHGTGTALGDVVEVEALSGLFGVAGALAGGCALGSVKSLIGHTKCAAGLAGLINASLALYHKVLPTTIGIENPNPKLDLREGPFRLSSQAEPWLHPHAGRPRRAGVSAFGFGGTNFHAVLEADLRSLAAVPAATVLEWPAELFIWQADDSGKLKADLDSLLTSLGSGARPALRDLANTLIRARTLKESASPVDRLATLAIVAGTHDELCEKLRSARAAIVDGRTSLDDPRGTFYEAMPPHAGEQVAFVFPGQGAQSPGMLRELAVLFPEVREAFEEFDRVCLEETGRALGPFVFTAPVGSAAEDDRARRALLATEIAQPAVGAACAGMLSVLRSLGCEPDLVAGHSYGELVALHVAGAIDLSDLARLSVVRGRLMRDAGGAEAGAMAALAAGRAEIDRLIHEEKGVEAANWNSPTQTVIAGPTVAVRRAVELAAARGIRGRLLSVSSAFHTELVASAREPLALAAERLILHAPDRPVYSNLDAAPHPADPAAIARRLGDHLASPVRFSEMIDAIYQAGARVFVEVGPGAILGPLVDANLASRPHRSVSTDAAGSPGLSALLRAVARLVTAGVPLDLKRLTRGRSDRVLDMRKLSTDERALALTPSTWLVNGSRARPVAAAEPLRLGQAAIVPAPPAPEPTARSTHAAPVNGSRLNVEGLPARSNPVAAKASANGESNGTGSAPARILSGQNGQPAAPTMKPTSTPTSDRVIESFQQTMQAFLEVQKSTMLAYLAGRGASGPPMPTVSSTGVDSLSNGHSASPAQNGCSRDLALAPPSQGAPRQIDPPLERRSAAPASEISRSLDPAPRTNGKPKEVLLTPHAVASPDREAIMARLLETVRDRTGYPIESLEPNLDMEADLGIDSIKRVEILGKLRDEFPSLNGLSESAEDMDALARARTLGAIVDRMTSLAPRAALGNDQPSPVIGAASPLEPSGHGKLQSGIVRRLLEIVDAPLPRERSGLMAGGRVVVTDDGSGLARELESRLLAAGIAVDCIGGREQPVDWTSPAAIDSVLDGLRSRGPLAGLVHTLAFESARAGFGLETDWRPRVSVEVKGLFLFAKAMAADLEIAARAGGASLIAATALGGRFASAGCTTADFSPGQGGIAGLIKTLAREWPEVRARVVDFSPLDPRAATAGRLMTEIFAPDDWAEVGYHRDRRIRLRAIESPLLEAAVPLELHPGDPVLISGGARGITALAAAELARLWRPTLLVIGTTPPPGDGETGDTLGLNHEAEIKRVLHDRLRREGRPAGPADIETDYQALRRAREVRENLDVLRRLGATVAYSQADVRDARAVASAIQAWRWRYGEIVGLVHGAGLIQDKLIRHKSVESFERVVETKLEGALNLTRQLRPEALKFTAFFSSIAGRFGNVGQSDYAAANEALSKLAHWLDRRWPGRVVSLIWGPWSGVGMVSELESHLGRRGLGLIAPEIGGTLLVDELRRGRKGDVEVIYSGALGNLEEPTAPRSASTIAEAVP
jgi:acyl transferase domain-containing protein/NAD(P)H-dependent flavin oxidoreductase YrpB (nitropropane dioxygenase family)/acyl carrier protein